MTTKFLDKGFYLFPLIKKERIGKTQGDKFLTGKEPGIKKWNTLASNDPYQVNEWEETLKPANWGIRTGYITDVQRLVIFDVDVKNDAGGEESFKLFIRNYGKLPETYMVKTASGGYHVFFYTTHPFKEVRKHFAAYPGIDILGENKYFIVAPGSKIMYEGKEGFHEYKEIKGSVDNIANLEDWLGDSIGILEKVREKKQREVKRTEVIKDGERNDALVGLVTSLWKGGRLSKHEIETTLLEYNKRLDPPESNAKIAQLIEWVSGIEREEKVKLSSNHLTDTGNAQNLRSFLKDEFIFINELKRWFYFISGVWVIDAANSLGKKTIDYVQEMYTRAGLVDEEDLRKALVKHVLKMESNTAQKNMIDILSRMISVTVLDFDRDPLLFNMKNGVFNLRNGEHREHNKGDLYLKQSSVKYKQGEKCPAFLKFLSDIFCGKQEIIDYMQKVLGRILSSDVSEQEVYIFFGDGENGKSTLTGVLKEVLGDYACEVPPSKFLEEGRHDSSRDYYASDLKGARAVFSSEPKKRCVLDMDMIKRATGGEELSARQPYGMPFKFMPEFKTFISTNNKPKINDESHGAWRRIRLIPFDYRVPANKKDKYLKDKLILEASGVFNWLYEGYCKWKKEGLYAPTSVIHATQEYKNEEDLIYNFLKDCCKMIPGARTATHSLYETFLNWGRETGERQARFTTQIKFSKEVKKHTQIEIKSSGGKKYFLGLGLLADEEDEKNEEAF